jgi:hypothetical protein
VSARFFCGTQFEFLPSLAFAVILLTNFVLLMGTFRAQASRSNRGDIVRPAPVGDQPIA